MSEVLPREAVRHPGWSRELMSNYWRAASERADGGE
jgi:hypothetical protein